MKAQHFARNILAAAVLSALGTVKQLLGALARQTWYHRVLI